MSHWRSVARVADCRIGEMYCIKREQQRILIANVAGQFYAVDQRCSHEDASLCQGALQGLRIKCPLHGSRFDLISGQALEDPATAPLRTYAVRVEQEQIYILLDD